MVGVKRSCLLLQRSKFESRRSLQYFFVQIVVEKNENKQKSPG